MVIALGNVLFRKQINKLNLLFSSGYFVKVCQESVNELFTFDSNHYCTSLYSTSKFEYDGKYEI